MFVVKAKSDFAAKRIEYLYAATKQEKYCDSIFSIRDGNFYVHLIVLTACSEFFGTNETQVSEICSDFDFEVIDAILKYCYTGEISIDDQHVEKLLELANRLEVKIPPQFKTVDLSNCLEVLKHTDDSELKKKALDLTVNNFKTLHKTQGFLNLPVSNVIEILKSDHLNVPSEEDVFKAVKLWINHDNTNRKIELLQLMRSIRFSLTSMEFLVTQVITYCDSSAECMTYVGKAILDKNNKSSIQTETPRIIKVKIAMVGGSSTNVANIIDIYDRENYIWFQSRNIDMDKICFSSVVLGNWLVFIGGKNSSRNNTLASVQYIDMTNGQKHPLKSMNQARSEFSAVTHSSTDIYAIGGCVSSSTEIYLSSVERWSKTTADWEAIAPLLMAVHWHQASVIGDNIYVTGGHTIENEIYKSTNRVQMYSVESNSWSFRANMTQARSQHASVVFRGKLFVAGGFDPKIESLLDGVEHYDPVANLWTAFAKLPKPLYFPSLCSFKNELLCMGGNDGEKYSNDIWEYDETNKSWKASDSLKRGRTNWAALVIPYDSNI